MQARLLAAFLLALTFPIEVWGQASPTPKPATTPTNNLTPIAPVRHRLWPAIAKARQAYRATGTSNKAPLPAVRSALRDSIRELDALDRELTP